jgi:hypothetical protein
VTSGSARSGLVSTGCGFVKTSNFLPRPECRPEPSVSLTGFVHPRKGNLQLTFERIVLISSGLHSKQTGNLMFHRSSLPSKQRAASMTVIKLPHWRHWTGSCKTMEEMLSRTVRTSGDSLGGWGCLNE